MTIEERIREAARAAGFDAAGIAAVASLAGTPDGDRFLAWLAAGRHGTMDWLARDPGRRLDPARVLEGARSVLVVARNSRTAGDSPPPDAGAGRVARYARRRDYHKVFAARLRDLEAALGGMLPGARTRRYVDTGPVLEKLWAERAGIGWRGKHTNLVSRSHGSWLLLGVILIDRDLVPDEPGRDHCGTCRRCIDACPTAAIVAPYQLDAGRCVAYLTIEHRGSIPRELRPGIGSHVFGCDDCLDVCPWNRFARETRDAGLAARPETLAPPLRELVALTAEDFLARFAGTPVMRARRDGLVRNACVALGNVGGGEALGPLAAALGDASPLVREQAAWAVRRIAGRLDDPEVRARAERILAAAAAVERDPAVLAELHSPQT